MAYHGTAARSLTSPRTTATAVMLAAAAFSTSATAASALELLKSPSVTNVWLPCISAIFLLMGIGPLWRRLDRHMKGEPRDHADNRSAGRYVAYIAVGLAVLVIDAFLRT